MMNFIKSENVTLCVPETIDDRLKPTEFFLEIIDNNETKIGVCGLCNLNFIDRKAESEIILNEDFYNMSLYLEVMNALSNHAFNTLNLKRIEGSSNNHKLHLYLVENGDYCDEGALRSSQLVSGKLVDTYIHSKIN